MFYWQTCYSCADGTSTWFSCRPGSNGWDDDLRPINHLGHIQGSLICEFVESDQPPWFHPWYRHAIRGKQNSANAPSMLPTDGMAIPRMNSSEPNQLASPGRGTEITIVE